MRWEAFTDAAKSTSWVVYVGTSDAHNLPHVAVVAPGFTDGRIWFATRPSSRKFRNLVENPRIGFHWPVGGDGPGELAAWGSATLHTSDDDKTRFWNAGILPFDLSGFWVGSDDPDLAFVEVDVMRAVLIGSDFTRQEWKP